MDLQRGEKYRITQVYDDKDEKLKGKRVKLLDFWGEKGRQGERNIQIQLLKRILCKKSFIYEKGQTVQLKAKLAKLKKLN